MSAGASKQHPFADPLLKHAGPPELTIVRYSGRPNFQTQTTLSWSLRGEKYFVGKTAHTLVREGPCESLLHDQQLFPLSKMAARNYLSPEEIHEYLNKSAEFSPAQMSFSYMTREMSDAEARKVFGSHLEERIEGLGRYDMDTDRRPVITSTLWSVAGQVFDPRTGEVDRTHLLPWQKDSHLLDPVRAARLRDFDRKKYPYIWEWGRMGQDIPGEVTPLFSVNGAINVQELIAMGGKLEDAYVMFHSLSEAHTRYFSSVFPDSYYPAGWTDETDAVYLVPLKRALEVFPPSRYSGKLARLIELSEGRLDEFHAIAFLQAFDRIQFTQFDSAMSPDQPLAQHDLSTMASVKRSQLVDDFGLTSLPRLDELAQMLMGLEPMLPSWNSGQYKDLADMQMSRYYIHEQNAIELSNLDARRAKFDPEYVARILMGALVRTLKDVTPSTRREDLTARVLDFMTQNQVTFAITTFEPELIKQVRRLGPLREYKYDYRTNEGEHYTEFVGQEWLTRGFITPPYTFVFSVEQIVRLSHMYPLVYDKAFHELQENRWTRHLLLTNPDLF